MRSNFLTNYGFFEFFFVTLSRTNDIKELE